MKIKTTDICDNYGATVLAAQSIFEDYGGMRSFCGRIATVKVDEDNVLVRKTLEEPGKGQVLVVDGGGSLHCALIGELIATLAQKNGWAGILVNSCIRDSDEMAHIPIGVKALNTNPTRSKKEGKGQKDIPVTFAGVTFTPGHYLYADRDGIVVSPHELALE